MLLILGFGCELSLNFIRSEDDMTISIHSIISSLGWRVSAFEKFLLFVEFISSLIEFSMLTQIKLGFLESIFILDNFSLAEIVFLEIGFSLRNTDILLVSEYEMLS